MSGTPTPRKPTPAEEARADWAAGRARRRIYGLLRPGSPRLDKASGLYIISMGCVVTRALIASIQAYNAELDALRKEHGLPSWAPGSRLPERPRLLDLMSDARPATTSAELDALRLDSLDYRLQVSDFLPVVVYQRLEREGLLLLGSDVSAKMGRIDVLDLREKRWMASEEFDRRQVGAMPWDQLPRDVKEAIRSRHVAEKVEWAALPARQRAEREAREQRAEANRERCADLLEKMKERDLACPHCKVPSRYFRFLPRSECFVCPSCARSSDALAFDKPD